MFDLGATELLLIAIVAIIVIGPKDLPLAMRTAGRWIGKIRRVSGHFRSGIESMIREAELEEMEKKWREQNEAILKENPGDPQDLQAPVSSSAGPANMPAASPDKNAESESKSEPQLPLPPP